MIGSVIGDVVGSIYEKHNLKSKDFELLGGRNFFTDDTVLTIATAKALQTDLDFSKWYRLFYNKYPNRGFGSMFSQWAASAGDGPYWSFGNGSAMRAGPIGLFAKSIDEVMSLAERSAIVTHNHPEGIKGAQAISLAVYLAKNKIDKDSIKSKINILFNYNFNRNVDEIRINNRFDSTCEVSVPIALSCFFESSSFEDAIRTAVSVGGDTDTICSMTGSIAEAFYGAPSELANDVCTYLSSELVQELANFYCYLEKR